MLHGIWLMLLGLMHHEYTSQAAGLDKTSARSLPTVSRWPPS